MKLLRSTYPFIMLFYLYGCSSGQTLYYGKADSIFTGLARVINESVTWREAHAACQNMEIGQLITTVNTADRLVYVRKVLKESGWGDEPLWIGFLKDKTTNKWNRIQTGECNVVNSYGFQNDVPDTQLCVLLNMSIATPEQSWYGVPCEENHPFLCEEDTGTQIQKITDAAISPGSNTSSTGIVYDCGAACCKGKMRSYFNRPVSQVDVANKSCSFITDDPFNFPVPFYVNTSVSGINVFIKTSEVLVTVVNTNGTYNYTPTVNLTCYPLIETAVTVPVTVYTTETVPTTTSTDYVTSTIESYTTTDGPCNLLNSTSRNDTEACFVFCASSYPIYDEEMLRKWLITIREDLKLDKKLLSSYIRTHISAGDDRMLSKALGLSGVAIMMTILSVVFMSDILNLAQGRFTLYKKLTVRDITRKRKQYSIRDPETVL